MSQDYEADAEELKEAISEAYGLLISAYSDEDVFPFPYSIALPDGDEEGYLLGELMDSVMAAAKALDAIPAEAVHPLRISVLKQISLHWIAAGASFIAFCHHPSRAIFTATHFCVHAMGKEMAMWVGMATGAIEVPEWLAEYEEGGEEG
jgi:hypothetical protein